LNVQVALGLDGARAAKGTVAIVDVFRAFTTAAFCVAAGAREIVLLADHEEALRMKRADPSLFLTGEIEGKPIPGFDAGNSPSVIEQLDLTGRRVVQRTSSGTQGVVAASGASTIALASFVIAGATARYLASGGGDVTIVAMGPNGDRNEDVACADHIASLIRGERVAQPRIYMPGDHLPEGWPSWFPRRDAELACEVDRFDFALPVAREDGLLIARPVHS
jgi:2-phosphosulfolactate phosphatase